MQHLFLLFVWLSHLYLSFFDFEAPECRILFASYRDASTHGIRVRVVDKKLRSLASRVRWGNLGLNWAFFEINRVSSQSRWIY